MYPLNTGQKGNRRSGRLALVRSLEDCQLVGAARNASAEAHSDQSVPGNSFLNVSVTLVLLALVAVLVLSNVLFDRPDFLFYRRDLVLVLFNYRGWFMLQPVNLEF